MSCSRQLDLREAQARLVARRDAITPDTIRRGSELCNELTKLALLATELGMPQSARALQEAVRAVGWEQAENPGKVGKKT